MLSVFMLNVNMLNGVMLSVVAPPLICLEQTFATKFNIYEWGYLSGALVLSYMPYPQILDQDYIS